MASTAKELLRANWIMGSFRYSLKDLRLAEERWKYRSQDQYFYFVPLRMFFYFSDILFVRKRFSFNFFRNSRVGEAKGHVSGIMLRSSKNFDEQEKLWGIQRTCSLIHFQRSLYRAVTIISLQHRGSAKKRPVSQERLYGWKRIGYRRLVRRQVSAVGFLRE